MTNKLRQQNTFTPKRSLGQNFLIAPKVAEKIATLATRGQGIGNQNERGIWNQESGIRTNGESGIRNLESERTGNLPAPIVLEVGPGRGMLTRELLKRTRQVIAIEKDDHLYETLQQTFSQDIKNKRLILVHGDAVDLLKEVRSTENGGRGDEGTTHNPYSILPTSSYTVAANIPYNITGELLRLFLEATPKPTSVTVLVQKEVAERIALNKGKESILSLSIKAYGEPHFEGKVARTLFRPIPNVDSAVLHIAKVSNVFFNGIDSEAFFKLLKLGFAHKRKLLLSNLSDEHDRETVSAVFDELGIPKIARAENLSLGQWKNVVIALRQKNH